MNAIEVKKLSFSYNGKIDVLKNVSFDIPKGQWVSIIGHNGSGKSTLSKLIISLLSKYRGEISVGGIVSSPETVQDIRRKVGIVFQNPDNQFVGVTVKDDIAFGLENREFESDKMHELIEKYANHVNMIDFLDKEPSSLSGGEKQRVAIAGILAMDTDIIIFDEATSMLDPKGTNEIMDLVKKLSIESDKTIITITHNLNEAILSDRILVLNDGVLVLDGTPSEVFEQEEILINAGLDILTPMKILKRLKELDLLNKIDGLEETLWQLSLKK